MAKLICEDGKVIKISKETEQELRKAFEPKKKHFHHGALHAIDLYKDNIAIVIRGWDVKNASEVKDIVGRGEGWWFSRLEIEKIIKGLQELIND